jgi:hypothetical protein
MSAFGGPNIVEDGLVLSYDGANIKSFRGEPTVNIAAENLGFSNMTQGGISYSFVGIEDGWRKYAITGTGNSNTYPYTFNIQLSTILVSTRTSFSFKYKTNVESKYVSFGDPRMVNIFYAVGRTTTNIQENDYRIGKLENVSPESGTEIQSQPIYFLSRPIEGTVFNPSTDFLYFKDVQAERLPYATPFVNGTRGTTVATGGGLVDRSENGNHGQLINGVTFNGDNLGSLVFDGVDDYILTNLTNEYSSYTINFFCKWNSSEGLQRIFGSTGLSTFTIRTSSNVNFHYNDSSSTSVSLSSNVNVGINKWCCITVTVDSLNNNVKIYINGEFKNSNGILPIANLRTNIFLGGQNSSLLYPSQFGIVQIYNRVLTADEVLQNYNATKGRFGL